MKYTILSLLSLAALAALAAPGWLRAPGAVASSRLVQALRADPDRDGLDAWAEARAGTDPALADTDSDGLSDYYSRATTNDLTYGERYDDGDGMPNDWERAVGLDPDRYDAHDDPDADGWTNWEEWMAGTDPRDPASVPNPLVDLSLSYDGAAEVAGKTVYLLDATTTTNLSYVIAAVPFAARRVKRIPGARFRNGWRRFYAYADLNGNGTFDEGEPAGLSPHESMVSYDTAQISIPLVDELFGFPRISWAASTNSSIFRYVVDIQDSSSSVVNNGIVIDAPRTFTYEWDYVGNGMKGINMKGSKETVLTWKVFSRSAQSTSDIVQEQKSFYYGFGNFPNNNSNGRRVTMQSVYPKSGDKVDGGIVEFRWKMDWRTEGVFITVKKNNVAVTGLNSLYVPFPVRHGDPAFPFYYYTAVPQIEGRRSPIQLSPGTYTYTITENLRTTALEAQSVSGSFAISDPASSRLPAISGRVLYWGRAVSVANFSASCVVQAFRLPDGATSAAAPSGFPVAQTNIDSPGAYTLSGLSPGLYAVRAFLDQNGNGNADEWETHGFGVTHGTVSPVFYATPQPLVVSGGDLEGVAIVLHPRDTDNDGLDDDWEWKKSGDLTTKNGSAADLAAFAADPVPGGQPFVYGE